MQPHPEGIAVIGLGVRLPGARNAEQFWKNLCAGVEAVTFFTDQELLAAGVSPEVLNQPNYVKAGVLLEGADLFDARFFGYTPREAELIDPQHRIFLECAWEALEDAGYVPDSVPTRVGIFAGAGINDYVVFNLHGNPEVSRKLNHLQKYLATDKDYLATRLSYKLDLKGPSLTIQSACSTSLVATHVACQSLLNGECDMALAGGVAIRLPQIAGYFYEQGSILSRDGHLRAFDARGQGIILGSGAGIVVLKRLEDALVDGDNVRAVIRGSAINNDGAAKIGYTAPSVDGQAAVIAEAQALAAVRADDVTYVEAHGTGTQLGDPIEIAALAKAFRRSTDKIGFCAIGSVKTNLGHLDAGAGVTGLIKTVLALENRQLPPSLNFANPNPAIDFAAGPFYVQHKLTDWQPESGHRIAGVSSFGIGGTNAHVVVEEAPAKERSVPSRPWQLLCLSASDAKALDQVTTRLSKFLNNDPSAELADVAYTLQRGRKAFSHRRTVAVNGLDDALSVLNTPGNKRMITAKPPAENATVAFLFSGQGAQHVNMGHTLYDREPVFHDAVNRCAEILQRALHLDLRTVLYPKESEVEDAGEKLRQTWLTQPALFTISYALAQLWMEWGIQPAAMLGHSIGEYVAATVSGVFELEDALAIVAERGRLMQQMRTGTMISVPLSEEQVQQWLREGISLAAVNSPSLSVLSGSKEAIEQVTDDLHRAGIEAQQLKTSHAFHSYMMDAAVEPFVNKVAKVHRSAPRRPFLSSLTGTWITADEAQDPGYWGRQMRHTVRFSSAVQKLLRGPACVLLELGPGTTLTTLASLHIERGTAALAVNSLPRVKDAQDDQQCILTALGRMWVAGVPIAWEQLYKNERRKRVPLPTYPFQSERYWIEPKRSAAPIVLGAQAPSATMQADSESGGTKACDSVYSRPELNTDYVAPATELEKRLLTLWQRVLGVELGVEDDFFEVGGHSLLAVTLMAEIEREFHQSLPLASLIQAPTVRRCAALLDDKEATPSWSPLVPLSTEGGLRPFFLMHSHGGNVLEYHALAQHLGKERPLYALQARGLDGHIVRGARMEDMAAYYLSEIRKVQSNGPYLLGGFCFGGFLALEAAQQLKAEGQQVPLVVMINSSTSAYGVPRSDATKVFQVFYKCAYRLALEHSNASQTSLLKYAFRRLTRLREMSQARLERLADSVSRRFGRAIQKHSLTYQLERLAEANDEAWNAYAPKSYDGKVLLLTAQRQPMGIKKDPALGWSGLLTGDFRVLEVPGFRQNMLDEPHVATIARILRQSLEEADSGAIAWRATA